MLRLILASEAVSNTITFMDATNLIVGLLGFAITIWTVRNGFQKQLDRIIQRLENAREWMLREPGILSRQQARQLIEYYLRYLKEKLTEDVRVFFEREFKECRRERDVNRAKNFVFNTVSHRINEHRDKLAIFRISTKTDLREFLHEHSPLQSGVIAQAQKEVFEVFSQAILADLEVAKAQSQSESIIQKASLDALGKIVEALKKEF